MEYNIEDLSMEAKNFKIKVLENILVSIIIFFLSLHLFTVHSKLLFHINPDKLIKELTYNFNMNLFSQELIVSTIGAIAYSLITALILAVFVKHKKVFIITVVSFALLDGIGVFVYYNVTIGEKLFLIFGALYYALYTASIIVSLGLFRYLEYSGEDITTRMNNYEHRINESILEKDIQELRETMHKILNMNNQNIQASNAGEKLRQEYINTEQKEVFDEKVLYLSTEKRKTQVEIAEELGISQPQVSRILQKQKAKNG